MKVLHLIGGGDVGGAKVHVLSLVKELSKYIDVKIVSFRPGVFADEAREMGINIEVVKTGNFIADIKRVVSIIKQEGYQIVHSHGAKANMFALMAKRFARLPTVTTVHSDYRLDYMHSTIKKLTFGSMNAIALRFIDYYIGVSSNFKQMLIRRKFNPDKIFTLYNGMDFKKPLKHYSREEFSRKYNLNLKDTDIVVGIAARLYPVKGISTLIKAAAIVVKKNPSVKFVIGGDGEERKSLEHLAVKLGVTDNVFFLGWLNDPYELANSVDISVLTSISESFPYSILEGARFGKATISSNVGGIPDLIENGVNGYLFNPNDHETLAEKILELASDPEKRNRMGEKLYQKASTLFSLENMCKTQLDIYNSILKAEAAKDKPGPNYDVIISGYYGFNNIGDDAMLMAIINNLRMYNENLKIIVLSKNPMETRLMYWVNSISRVNLFHVFMAMRSASLFIYGGGNIIQDNTSTRSLLYYLGTIWLAKMMKLKVMFYANGIGPLIKNTNKNLTRKILNQVDVITLREKLSLHELESLNIDKPNIILTADPALTVEPVPLSSVDEIFKKEGIDCQGPFIGFSVRKWQGYERYEKVIAQVADYVIEKYGLTPLFIPMHYPDDIYEIERVVSLMKGKGYIIRNKYTVPQTLGIISRVEMLIGMRLHALIFAASQGIPLIGLVYEPKIEGFLQYIGQASAGHVKDLEYDKLRVMIDQVWNNRMQISDKLKNDIVELKQKALENAEIAVNLVNGNTQS
ncbi:MAG TPA: polysaccharide pyruvyl transferase CsaB [Clostridiaceae bacterium]|nr:polysaccharide pyruvyl transferase CsaB [Clostridiaceae bacterium]